MGFNLGDILLKVKTVAEGTKETVASVKSIDDQAKESAENVTGFGEKFQEYGTKVGLGMAAVGAGLTLFAKKATDTTIEFTRGAVQLSRETGMTVEEASRLEFVAQRMGISVEESSKMFGILSKKIIETRDAAHPAETALGKLNIQTRNTDQTQRSFNDILLDVADRFKNMPNGVDKTTLAMELFGRAGKDMVPLLNQGRDGIIELQKKADELGITLTSENIEAFKQYTESTKELNDSQLALQMTIGEKTIPVMTEANKKFNDALKWALDLPGPLGEIVANFAAFGGPVLTAAGSILTFAANIATALPLLAEMKAALLAFGAVTVIGAALAIAGVMIYNAYQQWQSDLREMEASFQSAADTFAKTQEHINQMPVGPDRDKQQQMLDDSKARQAQIEEEGRSWEGVGGFFKGLGDALTDLSDNYLGPFADLWNMIWYNVGAIIQQIPGWFSGAMDAIGSFFSGIGEWFGQLPGNISNWLSQAWTNVSNWFSNIFNTATTWVSNTVNNVINWFSQLPSRIGGFLSGLVNSIGNWFRSAYQTASSWVSNLVNSVISWFASLPGRIGGALSGIGSAVGNAIRGAVSWALNAAADVGRAILNGIINVLPGPLRGPVRGALGFAQGGLVSYLAGGGFGGTIFKPRGTDVIPAMLSVGEFIMRKSAVDDWGAGFLQAMNSGQISPRDIGGSQTIIQKEGDQFTIVLDGVLAESQSAVRDFGMRILKAVDEERRAKQQPEILGAS